MMRARFIARASTRAFACAFAVCACFAQPSDADKPTIHYIKPSPWRPPFGLDRPGAPSRVRVVVPDVTSESEFTVEGFVGDASALAISLESEKLLRGAVEALLPSYVTKAVLVEARNGRRAPLGIAVIDRPELEAEAEAVAKSPVHPIDLGVVLPPKGWLVLGPDGSVALRVAASWNGDGEKRLTARTWFSHAAELMAVGTLKTSRDDREKVKPLQPFNHTDAPAPWEAHITLPAPPLDRDRSVLHVMLVDDAGVEMWSKDIPVMLVAEPPTLPAFGAVKTKLRYDEPISVLDLDSGALSRIPYEEGWDPALHDVVVALPGGGRFVFWRGSSYVPFWASPAGTGLSYEWAESVPLPGGFVDSVEPLMDKELRYGRVAIVESTDARVHVRWTYQSTDFNYKVWGDAAQEDFYFYPDGYGTRVLTLKSALDSKYEVSEFIVVAPEKAYPLEFLPAGSTIHLLNLNGNGDSIAFPRAQNTGANPEPTIDPPLVFRAPLHVADPCTAIYFNPRDAFASADLTQFGPFFDGDELATPAYWGSHWPLSRGKTTGGAIDDRIEIGPSHNSLLSWAQNRPGTVWERRGVMVDALGAAREMRVQQWAWLIGYTAAFDDEVVDVARSFAHPPRIEEVQGALIDVESYDESRRALRMTVEDRDVRFRLVPKPVCVNPVIELANAPGDLMQVSLGALVLGKNDVAWDGQVLWIRTALRDPAAVRITFSGR